MTDFPGETVNAVESETSLDSLDRQMYRTAQFNNFNTSISLNKLYTVLLSTLFDIS